MRTTLRFWTVLAGTTILLHGAPLRALATGNGAQVGLRLTSPVWLLGQEDSEEEETSLPPPVKYEPYDLLKLRPFDRLIFRKGELVVDILPLEQRPLPEPWPRHMTVELYNGDGREYQVDMAEVEQIKYFEDLLLEEGDKFLQRRQFENAWDFYNRVVQMNPKWPGLQQRLERFLYQEAESLLARQDLLRALNNLQVLAQMNPNYPGLPDLYGRAMDYSMAQAYDRQDYARIRQLIRILTEKYPDHEVAARWRDQLIKRARALFAEAQAAEEAKDWRNAAWRAYEAANYWPALPGLRGFYEKALARYPILLVAVRGVAEDFNPWAVPGTPDNRIASLLHSPLLRVSEVGERTRFETTIADWELGELGRSIRFQIRPGLRWSDGKPITAVDVARCVGLRVDPSVPLAYDATLASNYAGIQVQDLRSATVLLKRTLLRPEVLFTFPIVPGYQLDVAIRPGQRSPDELPVGSGPFYAYSHVTDEETHVRANPNFYMEGQPFIQEIVEREIERTKLAADELVRGRVMFVENVHPVQVIRLREQKGVHLRPRRVTAIHMLTFDFRKPELKSRELRRAIAYAINREAILKKALLNGEEYEDAWVAAGPFPRDSYAYEPSLKPWPYRPAQARALVEVVRSLRGGLPAFRLIYPNLDEAREAVKYIERYLETAGLTILPAERSMSQIERDIRMGAPFDIAYRIFYVRDPVFDAPFVLCPGQLVTVDGQVLPNCSSGWLRHLLTRLSLTTNWREATELLKRIQLDARDDVAVLPLWEIREYDAYLDNVVNVPDDALWTYDGVVDWKVKPRYPSE